MKKIIFSLILGLVIIAIGSTFYITNGKFSFESLSIRKDKVNNELLPKMVEVKEMKNINYIIKHIENLSGEEERSKKLNKYFNNLDLKELLLICAEIGYKYPDNNDAWWIVLPYVNKIQKELDANTYISIILNKEYPIGFRYLMIDMCGIFKHLDYDVDYDDEDKINNDLVSSDVVKNKKRIMKNLRKIIKDTNETEAIQLSALIIIDDYSKDDIPLFESIFNSNQYSNTIKGHALDTLYHIDKEYAYERINKILDNPEKFSGFEVRTAKSLGRGSN